MGCLLKGEKALPPEPLHTRFDEAVHNQTATSKSIDSPNYHHAGRRIQGLDSSLTAMFPLMRNLRFQFMADNIECGFAIGHVGVSDRTKVAWTQWQLFMAALAAPQLQAFVHIRLLGRGNA